MSPPPSPTAHIKLPMWLMCLSGGLAASVAEMWTIPFDTAKVRLMVQGQQISGHQELKYKGVFGTMKVMTKEEGFLSLYTGFWAGIQRQMIYASLRIGLYEPFRNYLCGKDFKGDPPIYIKIISGLSTGAFAMCFGQPTDLIKIRLQGEGKKAPQDRRYKGVMDAWIKIYKQEGILSYWTGLGPNVARNAIINAVELVTYDQAKQTLIGGNYMSNNIWCHFVCSAIAGFAAVIFGSPVDVVKTRIMNANPLKGQQYNGVLHCFYKTFMDEGFLAFYKGFNANCQRLILWNIIMFVTLEQIRAYFRLNFYNKSQ